jgi:hypothetical protein
MPFEIVIQRIEAMREGSSLLVKVEVRNTSTGSAYYLWSGLRSFSYDAPAKTLTLDLTGPAAPVPKPRIRVISKHPPRIPKQVPCPAGQIVVLYIRVPARVRRTSIEGPSLVVKEEPIGPIAHILCDLGYTEHAVSPRVSRQLVGSAPGEDTKVVRGTADLGSGGGTTSLLP